MGCVRYHRFDLRVGLLRQGLPPHQEGRQPSVDQRRRADRHGVLVALLGIRVHAPDGPIDLSPEGSVSAEVLE